MSHAHILFPDDLFVPLFSGHGMHVDPFTENVSASHVMHTEFSSLLQTVVRCPALHFGVEHWIHSLADVLWYFPVSHVHWEAPVDEFIPSEHCVHEVAPMLLYVPLGHSMKVGSHTTTTTPEPPLPATVPSIRSLAAPPEPVPGIPSFPMAPTPPPTKTTFPSTVAPPP